MRNYSRALIVAGVLLTGLALLGGAFTDQSYAYYSNEVNASQVPQSAVVVEEAELERQYPHIHGEMAPFEEDQGGGDLTTTLPESEDPPDLMDFEVGNSPSSDPFYVETDSGYYRSGWNGIPTFEGITLLFKYGLLFFGVNLLALGVRGRYGDSITTSRGAVLLLVGFGSFVAVEYAVPDYFLHLLPLAVSIVGVFAVLSAFRSRDRR